MFCTHCGAEIDNRAVICPHCGCATENYYRQAQPHAEQRENKPVNILAIVGMVLGILSFWLGFLYCILPIVALILSICSFKKVKQLNSVRGFAIAGLVTSIISLCIWLFAWIMAILPNSAITIIY